MSWYSPGTWFGKGTTLTLDQAISRLQLIRATASNIMVTPATAIHAPTVFAIVNAMSRAVASLPFTLLQDESSNGRRRMTNQPNHNVYRLLHMRPNGWQTAYEYWSLVMVRLLLYGKFYARKLQAANGRIVALQPVKPEAVRVEQLATGKLVFHVHTDGGETLLLRQNQMHWIMGLSLDGITGTTPVQQCQEAIGLEIAAERFGATVFGSGAIPNVVIKRKGHFKDQTALDRFKESWNKAFVGKRGTAVLEDDLDLQIVQLSNEESQFLESRKLQRTIIAGAFGVPPHIVGDLERATFSNIEHMSLQFINQALRPYLTCIEAAVERDLLTDREVTAGLKAMFDTSAMLRGDAKSRAEALRTQRQWGVINANEWRALEGLDAREDEGGDDYLTPMNFIATDGMGLEEDPNKVPTGDPEDAGEVAG